MTFSQIPYKRANLDHWKSMIEELTEKFKAAKTFEEADAIYYQEDICDADYATMVSLAKIRRDIDTRDTFYEEEVAFYWKGRRQMTSFS